MTLRALRSLLIVSLLSPEFSQAAILSQPMRVPFAGAIPLFSVQAITPLSGECPHPGPNAKPTLASQEMMRAYFTALINAAKAKRVTPGDLMQAVDAKKPDVIHYATVGAYLRGTEEGGNALSLSIIGAFEKAMREFDLVLPDRSIYESIPLPMPAVISPAEKREIPNAAPQAAPPAQITMRPSETPPPAPPRERINREKQTRATERSEMKAARRRERTERVSEQAAIVQALVGIGFSRYHAQETVASWPDPVAAWAAVINRREQLMQQSAIPLSIATRLALRPDASARLTQLEAAANRLQGIWGDRAQTVSTLFLTDIQKIEQRLTVLGLPVSMIQWGLAPLHGDLTEDGEPGVWYARLTTLDELKGVLRSGALMTLPETPLNAQLEKALIGELARRNRRTPWTLEEHHYVDAPLRDFRSPAGPNRTLIPITLAPIYRRYAATLGQANATDGSLSVSEKIADALWPEERAARLQAAEAAKERERETFDKRWKRLYDKYAAQAGRISAMLSAKALKRWQAAEEKAARAEQRAAERALRSEAKPARTSKPRVIRPKAERSPLPEVPPEETEPDIPLTPELLASIPEAGALEIASAADRTAIDGALSNLEQEAPDGLEKSALLLIAQRHHLTYRDLFRIVKWLSEHPSAQTVTQDALGIAMQRPWDGIDENLRTALSQALVHSAADDVLDPARATAVRRPMYSSLTAVEAGLVIPEDLAVRWRGLTRIEQIQWIRVASAKTRASSPGLLLAEYPQVSQVLGLSREDLSRALKPESEATALSLAPMIMTEDQMQCVVYSLQSHPTEIVKEDPLIRRAGGTKDMLLGLAERNSPKMNAVYLAERFHMYSPHNLNVASAGEKARLIVNRLGRVRKPTVLLKKKAEKEVSAYLKTRPVLPQNKASMKSYFHEQGLEEFNSTVSEAEKGLVLDLLQRLARDAFVSIAQLEPEDYRLINVQLADRSGDTAYFYNAMDRLNKMEGKGYDTPYFIRVRYGLADALPPLKELHTIDQFKQAWEAGAFPDWMPWTTLSRKLQVALVTALMTAAGKPAFWLTNSDYQTVPLAELSTADKPFTLRNLYLAYKKSRRTKSRKVLSLIIAEGLGLIKKHPGIYHPVQTLTTAAALKEALDNQWIPLMPWEYLSFSLIDQFLREVAQVAKKAATALNARDFETIPIPSLSTRIPGTRRWKGPKLRGLFARYVRLAPAGMPKLDFLHQEIARGLAKEKQALFKRAG